jgi:hypothetical protein
MKWKIERRKASDPNSPGSGSGDANRAAQSPIITITAWAVAACFTWLSIIYLPRDVLNPTLDPSYQGALSYFAEKQMQFGQQVMFTYGPLGYLVPEIYDGTFFGRKLICELLSKLVIAAVIIWLARRLAYLSRVLFLFLVWLSPCLGSSYPEVLLYLCIAGAGLILSSDDRRPCFVVPLLVFLAFVSLVKFTLLLYCALTIALLGVHWAFRGNWRTCLLIPTAYAALLLLGWGMAGQRWVNFSAWIATSLDVASGYQQCMGIDSVPGILLLAIPVALIGISLIGASIYNQRRSLLSCFPLLGLLAGFWISWKHGMIRADDHVNIFFGYSLFSFVCFPAFVHRVSSGIRLRQSLSALGAVLCLAGVYVENSSFLKEGPAYSISHVATTIRDLTFLSHYQAELNAALSLQKQQFQCPHINAEVGDSTVDVFGDDQGIALLNDLNYHPRPVFQSYTAYTPLLIRANANFYRSGNAPSFVISRLSAIDDRLLTLDDSEALRVLLLGYDLVLEEKGYLLWKKSALPRAATEEVAELETKEMALDQAVLLPGGDVWCVIDIKESALGKLRSFLLKPAPLFISLTDKNDRSAVYRFLPSIARCGFILDPYLRSQSDMIGLKTRFAPKPEHVSSVTLVTDNSFKKYFDSRITIHLSRIAPFAPDNL